MDARLYDRMAALTSIAFLLALAAGSYYLAVWAGREPAQNNLAQSNEPDVFVENVLLTEVNAKGQAVFRMSARNMNHFPIDGTSEFSDPLLVSLDPSRPTLTVVADRATILPGGSETVLEGRVRMKRRAEPGHPELTVHADQMTVNGNDETARTDGPVEILQGRTRLTGVGMEFDNVSRALQVSSQVRATIRPQSSPAAVPDDSTSLPAGERTTPPSSESG
ncbi:MAG: LPS export ABC transporter periplasmic protein LptC [Burkholderiaceae bacterium]